MLLWKFIGMRKILEIIYDIFELDFANENQWIIGWRQNDTKMLNKF